MVENDTARLCHAVARLSSYWLRLAGAIVTVTVVSVGILAPAAAAHQRRAHLRRIHHRRATRPRLPQARSHVASAHRRRARERSSVRTRSGGCRYAHVRIGAARRPQLQAAVVCLINQQRRRRGLPRLSASQRLDRSAQSWTDEMVNHRSFGHGANFSARISAVGFHWSRAAENVATGFPTPAAVVSGWMASAGHCQNILSPAYGEVGTGVSGRSGGGGYSGGTWTQDFALRAGQRDPSANWAPADGCPYG